jgi:hypothetical protein
MNTHQEEYGNGRKGDYFFFLKGLGKGRELESFDKNVYFKV